ncbi:MAG: TonB-dependent receptor [Caulobacterales bacterium]|nr:TonB-dependent receptor [Caulobacterales bacterium]
MKKSLLTAASAAAMVLIAPTMAQAQTEPAESAATAEEDGDLVVTGSRVIRNGNDAPTPITVVSAEELLTTKPTTVFESLADLPMFSGSSGVTNAPTNNTPERNSSVSALNLRNLGALRALALLDGNRVPPTTALGFVDINSLPTMLLERVDVVTGGASAVYGSDAVTGVINFVLDRDFDDVRIDASGGISEYGDALTGNFGIAAGTEFLNGRGHVMASFQHRYDDGIPHQNERDWAAPRWSLQGTGASNNPYRLVEGANLAFVTFGGYITCPTTGQFLPSQCPASPLVGYTFDQNGVLSPFQHGTGGQTNNTVEIGGDGAYQTWGSIKSLSETDQAYIRFSYEITDDLTAYLAVSDTSNYVEGHPTNLRFFGQGVRINSCNAFLAGQYQTQLGCTNQNDLAQPTFMFNKIWNFESNQYALGAIMSTQSDNMYVIGGLEGELGDNWNWEASYTRSEGSLLQTIHRNQDLQRTYAALDAVIDPSTQQVVCRAALTNPSAYGDCVPLNVFGPSAETQAAMDYIFRPVSHETTFEFDDFAASIAGSFFSTWAGPVDLALSGGTRRQTLELVSTSTPGMLQNCAGLRTTAQGGNCNATAARNTNAIANRTPVEQQVTEVAVEVNVPLLADHQFADAFDVNAAYRHAEYENDPGADPVFDSRSFDAQTWKVGFTWDITSDLTVRAARSRDIRAPNLWDLYSPASTTNSFTNDTLLNIQGNVALQSGGNPDLDPEVGDTTTVGVVWRPTPDFSLAVDFYDIKISDALATLSGQSATVQQACFMSGGTSPLCALYERAIDYTTNSPSNVLTRVYNRQVNIAEQTTNGVDVEANWRTELFSRDLTLRALVTYQPELIFQQQSDGGPVSLPTVDQAGVSYTPTYNLLPSPVWKFVGFLSYDITENFTADVSYRWRSELEWSGIETDAEVGGIDDVGYTNLNLRYRLGTDNAGDYTLYFNIQNLFNTDPPPSGTPGLFNQPGFPTNGFAVGDDVVGRYYTVGVRARF